MTSEIEWLIGQTSFHILVSNPHFYVFNEHRFALPMNLGTTLSNDDYSIRGY